MHLRTLKYLTPILAALALAGSAFAFEWTTGVFPSGDQHYTLEFRYGSGEEAQASTVDIDLVDRGGTYTVTSTVTSVQEIAGDELDLGVLTLGNGMGALGPSIMFGPMFMFLPMMLEGQDIRVRDEPIVVLGMGEMHMERTEQVAGLECVVVRFEQPDSDLTMEFALAEGLPFPCFSRYGSGDEISEFRLLEADF